MQLNISIMIWINLNTWNSFKFSTFLNYSWTWKRYYNKGYRWTPFIYLQLKPIS